MSDVITKREIQTPTRALAHVIAIISLKAVALGHRVVLSTTVRRYVNPADGCRGPTMSYVNVTKTFLWDYKSIKRFMYMFLNLR